MNVFKGTKKADVLGGQPTNDTILGRKGADTLFGGDGSDVIKGGKGRDTLYGGEGGNVLTGGKGADTFILSTEAHFNIITDFEPGKDKVIINDPGHTGFILPTPLSDLGYDGATLTYKGEPVGLVTGLVLDNDVFVS